MNSYKIDLEITRMLLSTKPGKGNPVPVRTEPEPDEPHRGPLKPKRRKKREYDIVMQ